MRGAGGLWPMVPSVCRVRVFGLARSRAAFSLPWSNLPRRAQADREQAAFEHEMAELNAQLEQDLKAQEAERQKALLMTGDVLPTDATSPQGGRRGPPLPARRNSFMGGNNLGSMIDRRSSFRNLGGTYPFYPRSIDRASTCYSFRARLVLSAELFPHLVRCRHRGGVQCHLGGHGDHGRGRAGRALYLYGGPELQAVRAQPGTQHRDREAAGAGKFTLALVLPAPACAPRGQCTSVSSLPEPQVDELQVEYEKTKGSTQGASGDVRKELLRDLEERAAKNAEKEAALRAKSDALVSQTGRIKDTLQSMFDRLGCSTAEASGRLGKGCNPRSSRCYT